MVNTYPVDKHQELSCRHQLLGNSGLSDLIWKHTESGKIFGETDFKIKVNNSFPFFRSAYLKANGHFLSPWRS